MCYLIIFIILFFRIYINFYILNKMSANSNIYYYDINKLKMEAS